MENVDWMKDYMERQAIRSSLMKATFECNKNVILDALRGAGIGSAELAYDGVGDSGCLYAPDFYSSDNKPVTAPDCRVDIEIFKCGSPNILDNKSMPLSEALETVAYDALEVHHPGWEINEGAYGTFKIEVEEGTMTLCNSLRSTDYTENEICGED